MKPIKFPEHNVVFAENQPEYMPLPAFKDENGVVISCWRLSLRERLHILIHGNMWLSLMSFNKPLTPSFLTPKKSEILITEKQTNRIVKKNLRLLNKLKNDNPQ